MRNLLCRGIAVALSGCISLTFWLSQEPTESVEFALDANCLQSIPEVLPAECLSHGKLAQVTV